MSLLSEFTSDLWGTTGGALGKEIDRVWDRLLAEGTRFSGGLAMGYAGEWMMESLMPSMPVTSTTPSSTSIPMTVLSGEQIRRPPKGRGSSFKETILTGDLVPTNTGKKTLLG